MICCENIVDVALFFLNSSHVISATTIFFSAIFGNDIATIAKKKKKNLFQQCHCHIWFSLRALTLRAPTRAAGISRRNFGDGIAENQKFLSPTFSFSLLLLLNFSNGIAEIHSLSSYS